ncbi:ATP-binding protein [Mycolicibacterium arenosum]|uniref:ATP-binding protein n=1 Tax=Mycolicibacterium arenosum TaxID=2952157 RepID=A0ABT1MDB6_9MYCO|nr:ATP-binding protein [Mycolicibacterium sp. CAU 1645]MCP9276555.1 ATP-binding protein [Mycolicibacterium sp. CAU 1645]
MDLLPPIDTDELEPLTADSINRWSETSPADNDEVWIDLSRVAWIDPMGLVVVAATAEDAAATGRTVRFTPPLDRNVRSYMSRMHLDECLRRFCPRVDLPRVRERNTAHRLSELRRFDGDAGDALADQVFEALCAVGKSRDDAKSFYKGVSEVVSNVIDHSGVSGGWAAMQVQRPDLITFAIADAGDGLQETLSRHNEVEGPVDAMEKAFLRECSGTGALGRGTGLDDLVQRVRRHRGQLRAWSGKATGYSAGGRVACRGVGAAFPGTVIYAEFKPERRGGMST